MQSFVGVRHVLACAVLGACGDGGNGDGAATDASTGSTSTTAGTQGSSVEPPTTTPDATSATPTTTDAPADTTDAPADTTDAPADTTAVADDTASVGGGDCDFSESFDDLPDGSDWPAHWTAVGGVAIADVQGGRGRLVPSPGPYALARLVTPLDCVDIEVSFAFELSQPAVQGVGLYVRQNGGYLQQTVPPGEGYVAFIQGFMQPPGIGIWRERSGTEELIGGNVAATIMAGVPYRARLRVTQQDAQTTLMQARVWPDGANEPGAWQVERTDMTPSLQGTAGALAVDTYNVMMQNVGGDMFFDDIVATAAR
jgi:hypothetical protein